MSLAQKDLRHTAHLAQIALTDAQVVATLTRLNAVFSWVDELRDTDTQDVVPLAHPIALIDPHLACRLREDIVTETDQRERYQKVAPAIADGLYLVPKVIE